jgi:outer membrane protein assembly factor BamB
VAVAAAAEPEWPQLQGGPGHAGVAAAPVLPPLQVQWRFKPAGAGDRGLSAVAVGTGMAVANRRSQVVAFDPATGAGRWTHPRAAGSLSAPAVAPEAGEHGVVITSEGLGADSAVLGLDLTTGSPLWTFKLKQPVVAAPAVEGDVAYVGGQDHLVYALDVATGELSWKARTAAPVLAAPAVGGGRVYAVSEDPATGAIHLVALDSGTGKQVWSFSPPSPGLGSSAPLVSGDRVYIGFGDDTVRALDARTGAERWASPVRAAFSPSSAPALAGRSLFVADDHGAAYRFDTETGTRIWDFQFDALNSAGAPLVDGPFVLLGLDDGSLAALDVSSGDLRWRTDLGVGPVGPVAAPGGLVLVPLRDAAGGVAAMQHDAAGALVRIESPTVLHPGRAVGNFAAAFAGVLVLIVGAFGLIPGLRSRPRSESPSDAPFDEDAE